jgi:hypothetical protein
MWQIQSFSGRGENERRQEKTKPQLTDWGLSCVRDTAEGLLALNRNPPWFDRFTLGQVPLEDAVRDAGLSIPARWAYIIPSGMHAALSS